MRLATIDDVPGGSAGAQLSSGEYLHLGRAAAVGTIETWLPNSLAGILEGGPQALAIVQTIVDRAEALPVDASEALRRTGTIRRTVNLLAPIPRPRLILAAGLAYKSHLAEMSGTPSPQHPTAFMKSPTSVSGPGVVMLPPQAPGAVDFEGELACVFGRQCHQVTGKDALSYVAGYTVANDLSARDWVSSVWGATSPWEARLTWEVNLMGKQFPGFTALGPVITTSDEIAEPATLHLTTRLNGQIMQSSDVGDMIFPLSEVIAYLSRWYTFLPGDVLLTGTPAGVGVGRKPPIFLRKHDAVEVEIDRIGTLITQVE